MVYTFADWNVTEGHTVEFERGWQRSVDQLAPDLPGVVFRLLRDVENPGHYISVGGPWRSQEQVDSERDKPAYRDAMAETQTHLVESSEVRPYELVVEVS